MRYTITIDNNIKCLGKIGTAWFVCKKLTIISTIDKLSVYNF